MGVGTGISAHRSGCQSPSNSSSSLIQPIHGALNDTSLAAISENNGDRHLFFQDVNGTIRHVVFSQSLNAWSPTVEYIPTERQPRLHTPLAVDFADGVPTYIVIFYADTNDTLAAIEYSVAAQESASSSILLNDSFAISRDSRSLTISRLHWNKNAADQTNQNSETQLWQEWLLIYSSPSSTITFLYGNTYITDLSGNSLTTWEWQNVSQPFYAQSNPNGRLGEPFFAGRTSDDNMIGHFFNPQSKSDSITYPFLTLAINNLSSKGKKPEYPRYNRQHV